MARIDVHAHFVPPSYRAYCLENDFAQKGHPDGMPAIPPWDSLDHIALMKHLNIQKSVGDRRANEDMAKTCADHPDHFLFFASLPLPDVEGSLEEIDFAMDISAQWDFKSSRTHTAFTPATRDLFPCLTN
ncbi:hypothetical protein N7490_001760 [Penicillium lividum]|nr:hypothetical protein N7490_001760 [Penicillium lividum]